MKVLAFLQNQWFADPARIRAMLDRQPDGARRLDLHRRLSHYALSRCHSGRRLRTAFGDDRFHDILWENVSPEIGGFSASVFPADPVHIRKVLSEEKPAIVLAFGRLAIDALPALWKGPMITAPHPAARQSDVPLKLKAAAEALASFVIHFEGDFLSDSSSCSMIGKSFSTL